MQYKFKQWRNHYYHVCQQNGISRQCGITSHGLRHERLNEIYQEIAGQVSPIKSCVNSATEVLGQVARQEVSEIAGHSRWSIAAAAYLGGNSRAKS